MWKQERTDGDMRRKCREGRGRLTKAKEGGEGGRLRIGPGLVEEEEGGGSCWLVL